MPFPSVPGQEVVLPDSMLGLPPVDRWPPRGGPIPWILDPAEHPRPDDPVMSQSIGTTGTKKRKRPKKKKTKEFRVTQKGVGNDEPEYVTCSGSSEASDTTAGDSGVNLASPVPSRTGPKKAKLSNVTAGSNASRTPPLSPDARKELDTEAQDGDDPMEDDNPLSGASDHPISDADAEGGPVSSAIESSEEDNDGENGDGKDVPMDATPIDAKTTSQLTAPVEQTPVTPSTSSDPTTGTAPTTNPHTGTAPGAPSGDPDAVTEDSAGPDPTSALAYAIQSRVLASPALAVVMAQIGPGFALDATEDEERQKEYQGVMRGLRGVARIMSDGFEKATADVQAVVNQSLAGVIRHDIHFIEGASSTLMKWVRAVQPAIDSLDRPHDVQGRLRREAHRDGMQIAREVLSPYDVAGADDPNLDPLHEIIVRSFAAARAPIEKAIIAVHDQLAPLAEEHVPPDDSDALLAPLRTTADLTFGSGGDLVVPPQSGLKEGCWEDFRAGFSMTAVCQSIPVPTLLSLPAVMPTGPLSFFPFLESTSSRPREALLLFCPDWERLAGLSGAAEPRPCCLPLSILRGVISGCIWKFSS